MLTGHSAVLPTVTAFAVAFALGALLYTLQRQLDDAIRRIRLCWFGGDAIALLAMLVTLYAFKHEVASAIPDDINPATLITNIHIALFVTMAGGWVVLALSERLPRILLWLLRVSVLIIAGAFIVAGGIVVDVVKLPFTTRFVNLGVASA
ncbi:MAG TPA: hypothetical protein EYP10_02255, partial [Armatimonadetes bacterium]|nr:hypothetical protein [Armatimonadota bacterium]